MQSQYGINLFSWLGGLATLVLLVVLALLCRAPLRRWASAGGARNSALLPIAALGVVMMAGPAHAYYDKNNYTEVYFILPNESAFFIPDQESLEADSTRTRKAQPEPMHRLRVAH